MKPALVLLAAATIGSPVFAQDWPGLYGGAALSYDAFVLEDVIYGFGPIDLNGAGASAFVGYNVQSGKLVYSAELAVAKHGGKGFDGSHLEPATARSSVSLRGRIGFATGKALPYLAVGAYRTRFDADHDGPVSPGVSMGETASGRGLALGVDWSLSERSVLRAEFESIRYKDGSIGFGGGSDPHDYELDAHRMTLGYAIRF